VGVYSPRQLEKAQAEGLKAYGILNSSRVEPGEIRWGAAVSGATSRAIRWDVLRA
jgi:hypothetical protein